jgi:hypothetical protein
LRNKKLLKKYLPYSILVIAILSLNPYTKFPLQSMTILWTLEVFILYLFYSIIPYVKANYSTTEMNIVTFYLFYNVFSFVRGLYVAEIYWDYKALVNNGFALMLPVVAFAGTTPVILKVLLKFYLKYTLPLLIGFYFIISTEAVGFFLVPISFLVLFLPVIKKPWNVFIVSLCMLVFFIDLGARSNIIKFFVPLLLSFVYYFKFIYGTVIIAVLQKVLLVLPVVLFCLAVGGYFNVFKINEYLDLEKQQQTSVNLYTGESQTEDLTTDTRTPLYVEVLNSAGNHDSWLIGRSPARGNDTELFGSLSDITGRQERAGNEVAILNVFTWTGIVGVLFYFLVFYRASYFSIKHSNNRFSKILGIYVAFRWCCAWVEDINFFTLNTFILWLIIGLCFSRSFRKMNDREVEIWINSCFPKLNYVQS